MTVMGLSQRVREGDSNSTPLGQRILRKFERDVPADLDEPHPPIELHYPDISEEEVEEVRHHVVTDSVVKNGEIKEVGDKRFVLMAGKFVNIDDLNRPD